MTKGSDLLLATLAPTIAPYHIVGEKHAVRRKKVAVDGADGSIPESALDDRTSGFASVDAAATSPCGS
jgi:hypothetical protein